MWIFSFKLIHHNFFTKIIFFFIDFFILINEVFKQFNSLWEWNGLLLKLLLHIFIWRRRKNSQDNIHILSFKIIRCLSHHFKVAIMRRTITSSAENGNLILTRGMLIELFSECIVFIIKLFIEKCVQVIIHFSCFCIYFPFFFCSYFFITFSWY